MSGTAPAVPDVAPSSLPKGTRDRVTCPIEHRREGSRHQVGLGRFHTGMRTRRRNGFGRAHGGGQSLQIVSADLTLQLIELLGFLAVGMVDDGLLKVFQGLKELR